MSIEVVLLDNMESAHLTRLDVAGPTPNLPLVVFFFRRISYYNRFLVLATAAQYRMQVVLLEVGCWIQQLQR